MRTKDRLPELQRLQLCVSPGGADGAVYCDTTAPLTGAGAEPAPAPELDALLEEVERTRGWIRELERNTQLLRRLHADPTFHTNKHLQEQLDSVITGSNALGLKVCGALRQLEARAGERRGGDGCTRARAARLQYACTRRLYADALAAHECALAAARDDQLQLLRDQIKLTNLTVSDEECQSLLDTNNIALFVDNVRAETAEARSALRDVEVRHEELLRAEHALRDVRDLFVQLAHLVAAQQEQVDSVEYYALQAGEHVDNGGRELLKGSVTRSRARKKKVSVIICLVSGFLLVLLVLLFT